MVVFVACSSCGRSMLHKIAKAEFSPLGVVGAIVSWNYPFHNIFNPMLAAVFSGNSIVIKVCFFLFQLTALLVCSWIENFSNMECNWKIFEMSMLKCSYQILNFRYIHIYKSANC